MSKSLLHHWSGRGLRTVFFSAAAAAVVALTGCSGSSGSVTYEPEAFLDAQVTQIGGATTAVAYTSVTDTSTTPSTTTEYALYSMANRLAARPINITADTTFGATVKEITLPGYIKHITPVSYDDGTGVKQYALVSMGGKGLAVVDVSNPGAMVHLRTITVDYDTPAYDYVDGGGTHFTAALASHTSGPVNDVLVDDKGTKGTPADYADDELFIANGAYGIQKTLLSNVMSGADAALPVASMLQQTWTLKYAGENPWGGPLSLKMYGGKLYAALGFLGMGIYDPAMLTRTAAYNKYADCAPGAQEDWFGFPNLKPKCNPALLANASYIDGDGMPTWEQAGAELADKSGTTVTNYPWAQFDRYGKYYYNALTLDVQTISGGPNNGKTIAYIAYALGGLVAVDVSGATPSYLGYVPASPAHGPDEPTGSGSTKSILSYHGAGMLKDAGVQDVHVVDEGGGTYRAYYTDHFAGLVVASGADNPTANWKNPHAPYDNNTNPQTFWPDYEFVTSYDMTPVLVGDEAIPMFLTADSTGNYTGPVMLATGELNGHGGAFFMMPNRNTAGADQVDIVEASGGGGVSFVDIKDLANPNIAVANRFGVPVQLVSTNEVGAAPDGTATQMMAIGHAEGLAVSGNYLYLADGPHGMSVWSTANDNIHVVANTLQSEYPATVGTELVYPAPHAYSVAFAGDPTKAFVLNQSVGLRKVNVSAVTGGTAKVGTPSLLKLQPTDIYEHSTEAGGNLGNPKIVGQDHAYGVAFYGKYAIVADGGNGLTVYDVTVPADATTGAHIVANLGGTTTGQAPLGRAAAVKLWTDASTGRIYAVVAAGSSGISVVDMSALLLNGTKPGMTLIKTFEPLKSDADNMNGSADGKSVDVQIVGDYAYISYDSFGVVAYSMASLIQPVAQTVPPQSVWVAGQTATSCALVTDVTKLSPNKKASTGFECRPTAAGRFKLQTYGQVTDATGVVTTPSIYANVDGGAQHMRALVPGPNRLLFYVAYSDAGVLKLDWSDPANPKLMQIKDTVGSAGAVAVANGRVYVSDGTGGLVVFK